MERKSNEPRLTQKQICIQLGYSDSTNKRYRDEFNMDFPYRRNKYRLKILQKHKSKLIQQMKILKKDNKK